MDLDNIAFEVDSAENLQKLIYFLDAQGEPIYSKYSVRASTDVNWEAFRGWRYFRKGGSGTFCGIRSPRSGDIVINTGDLFNE